MFTKIKQFFKKVWKLIIGLFVVGALAMNIPPQGAIPTSQPTYFAEVDSQGIVLRVLVISQEMINTGNWGDPKNWVETTLDGSKKKNYAGKGYKYDKTIDAFIEPKPRPDAILDGTTGKWKFPVISISPTASI